MSNQTNYYNPRWMSATPAIDTLSLCELTLPGTHNAGSDWQASYPFFGPPPHWLACQHDRFYSQLRHGSRALDIRLTYVPEAQGPNKFQVHHNGHRNSRTVGTLITDVNEFLQENPDEFIILDFHSLEGKNFDFDLFNKLIIQFLGHCLIPSNNVSLSLNQLKQISAKQRVLAAAPQGWGLDRNLFLSQIRHKWSGNGITDATELRQFIGEVMHSPPGNWAPWSLSATSYTALGGPVDIHDELNAWFDPDKSDWALKCNIINVDFMEESKIVDYCRTANLMKARQRNR
ncbi:phospholipase [Pseudomonas frederiksbergensis]|uniref:phospholipase n=1 Tax=Pseudomonas frederiksbergensis TaxID=104087 RepID=UPI00197FD22E|nr:phospholipase [Pseudomonas frederiksbergensis]MBN3862459.1 phospholipase [Pseudomonas frederiksbergensis]